MVNYNEGKIYRIVPNCEHEPHEIYIGSTTKQYLSQRMTQHRALFKRWGKGKTNRTNSFILFEKYGIDNCVIMLIENVSVNSKEELMQKERFYIENSPCLNKYIPLRTQKEWNDKHHNQLIEYHKLYRQINKGKRAEQKALYYESNKEIINQKQGKKVECICGSCIRIGDKAKHIKSKKHQSFVCQATL